MLKTQFGSSTSLPLEKLGIGFIRNLQKKPPKDTNTKITKLNLLDEKMFITIANFAMIGKKNTRVGYNKETI